MPRITRIARPACLGFAVLLGLAAAAPVRAADEAKFKAEIDAFAQQLNTATHGVVTWENPDAATVRSENGTDIATILNPRIAIKPGEGSYPGQLTFDRVEMRSKPEPDGKRVKLSIALPSQAKLVVSNGKEVNLSLKDATGEAIMEEPGGRLRESSFTFTSARLEQAALGIWVKFGPLTAASKTASQADGTWKVPTTIELKQIEFFVPDGPVSSTIDRIAYTAQASGPNLATFDKVRDDLASLRQDKGATPDERLHDLVALLPTMMAAFTEAKGEFSVEGIAVRAANGEALVSVDKTGIGGALTGMAGDNAALRMTMRNEGLTLSSSVLEQDKVPRRVVLDFGLENISTAALRKMLDILATLDIGGGSAPDPKVNQQLLGAAAMLNPVFRIYELDLEAKDAGLQATAETTGSPLAPKGYTADADLNVRGIDNVPKLFGDAPYAAYLPLLKEIGKTGNGPDGSPRLLYHLASAPQKWLTLNGVDVTGWFADGKPTADQVRVLRPAEPPLQGNDVKSVQRALAAAKLPAPQDGVYGGDTAAAVARFQKQNGLNPDGVVDVATRDKLGVKPEPATVEPAKPAPAAPGGGRKTSPNTAPPGWGDRKQN